jgi:DNA repair/transcription protein MET18/MMS19
VSARRVTDGTLPLLFVALPDEAPGRDSPIEISKYRRVLQLLARLCIQPTLFETLVIRLSAKLDLLFARADDTEDTEPVAAYAHSLLQTISRVLAAKVKENHVDIPKYLDLLIIPLYNLFVSSALKKPDGIATNERLLVVAGKVVSFVVRVLPTRYGW